MQRYCGIESVRKLATAAAVSLILASSGAHALGLGDIEMRSALNQPMNAQIRLTSVQPGEADGMIVTLAAPDAFNRAGIERSQALKNLKFAVDYEGPSPVIRISSSTPVVEPFLNFLLEVQWPTGRMVREYTVLLDPPVFMTPNATARNTLSDSPVLVERGEQAIVAPTPIERNTNLSVAEEFDESSVVVIGSAEETIDAAGTTVDLSEVFAGEEVSLEETPPGTPLENAIPDEGEVISLTDLGAANTEALDTISTSELKPATVDFDFPEVELVGSTEEVSNDFVAGEGAITEIASEEVLLIEEFSNSEVVTLEELAGEEVVLEEFEFTVEEFSGAASEITVRRGQTLGEIAKDNAVSGVSTQQMLMALLNANEGAFINNNVNLVKAGAILRIPDADEASQMSQSQAVAQLGEQNQLWREYRDSVRSKNATQVATNENTSSESTSSSDSQSDSSSVSTAQAAATDELKIVASDEPVAGSTSATSAEAEATTTAQLGDINRKLQLAREELASTKLESSDLGEQVASLEGTGEDLNTLVTLRQNEVAQLQEQLRKATVDQQLESAESSEETEAADTTTATAAVGGAVDQLNSAVEDAASKLTETGEDVASAVTDATDTVAGAADAVTDTDTDTDTGTGTNALTEAGQTLGQVDLVDSETTEAADAAVAATNAVDPLAATTQPEAWYQKLFREYGKLGILGILGLCAIGLIGLLFKKKRKTDDRLDFKDEVEFIDEGDAGFSTTDVTESGAAAAGAAAVGGAAVNANDGDELEVGAAAFADVPSADALDDELDGDSTISEIDVYLAYGLHSQAEELLTKAVERNPENPEYAEKLLQTYHAQGNTEAFNTGAVEFQQNFGEGNEQWASIVNMGHEVQPDNALYAGGGEAITRMGTGDLSAPKLESDDFITAGESSTTGSVNRDFSQNDAAESNDETALMDESLDPGFAFNEADLEATGDFSEAASEIAEDSSTIDFPDFDKTDIQTIADDGLDGALTLDELDIGDATAANGDTNAELGSLAEDLTLDLDKLSGDLELDTTALLEGTDAGDLEIPDLTSDNELLTSAGGADEMDTMMDLAKAYIDMGDKDSASSTLGEIVKSGNPAQVSEAEILLRKIS